MKIGLISGEYPPMPGGVGAFTRILAQRLQQQGHQIQLLCRDGSEDDGAPITTVSGWGLRSVPAIRAWSARHDFDVINLQYQTAAYDMSALPHFLPSLLDTPLITTFHDLRYPYLFPKAGRLRDWIVLELARGSDGLIVTNPEDDARLSQIAQRAMIPIGSNIMRLEATADSRQRWRETIGAADSSLVLGHFGFITPLKGVDALLEAIAQLRDRGLDLRLIFIGGRSNSVDGADDGWLADIDQRMLQLGLSDIAHFTGYLPENEIAACIASVDLMCLPYRDGASFRRGSLLAAINQGSAVLTTRPAVAYDSFMHGENLWLIDVDAPAQIAEAIQLLNAQPERLRHLRAGARELRKRFDWDDIARRSAEFFAHVGARAGA